MGREANQKVQEEIIGGALNEQKGERGWTRKREPDLGEAEGSRDKQDPGRGFKNRRPDEVQKRYIHLKSL